MLILCARLALPMLMLCYSMCQIGFALGAALAAPNSFALGGHPVPLAGNTAAPCPAAPGPMLVLCAGLVCRLMLVLCVIVC